MKLFLKKINILVIKDENGSGFVESLIAIVIAGIACVALLSLGASLVREATKNEMIDAMDQHALAGLDKVKAKVLVDPGLFSSCSPGITYYYIEYSGEDYSFTIIQNPSSLCSVREDGSGTCEKLKLRDNQADPLFFREIEVTCPQGADSIQIDVVVGTLYKVAFGKTDVGDDPDSEHYETRVTGIVPK